MPTKFSTPSQGSLKSLMDPAVSKRRRFLSQLDYEDVILGRLDLTGDSKDPEPGEDGLVAEISASVWIGNKMYTLSSGGSDTLSLSNWSDPFNPQLVSQTTLEGYFTTSVASYGDLLAVAATPEAYEEPGQNAAESNIIFYSINPSGTLMEVGRVAVGDLADGIAFSEDGTQLYVANEGQPRDGYELDPTGSVSIINLSGQGGTLQFDVVEVKFPELDDQGIELQGIERLGSGIRTDAGLNGDWQEDAEPEYVAAAGDYLFVTLQESNTVARIDLTDNKVDAYIGLGWVDYSQVSVDLTNKDADDMVGPENGFNPIEGQNVVGLRMADGMDAWQQGEDIFFITANEGDAREYDTNNGDVLLDEIRNKDLDTSYSNVPGRLKLVNPTVYLETDEGTSGQNVLILNEDENPTSPLDDFASEGNDGEIDERSGTPVSFGSRSISIFDGMSGDLVWDSWMTDNIDGTDYNTSLQNIAEFAGIYDDGRSDDKGVEPESVVIVEYEGSNYAVASLERTDAGDKTGDEITGLDTSLVEQGGLLVVYDVTNTDDVDFITYQQVSRAPEGLEVIEAPQSPTGRLLLGVSSEYDSNSVELFDFAAMLDNGNGDEYLKSDLATDVITYATLDPIA